MNGPFCDVQPTRPYEQQPSGPPAQRLTKLARHLLRPPDAQPGRTRGPIRAAVTRAHSLSPRALVYATRPRVRQLGLSDTSTRPGFPRGPPCHSRRARNFFSRNRNHLRPPLPPALVPAPLCSKQNGSCGFEPRRAHAHSRSGPRIADYVFTFVVLLRFGNPPQAVKRSLPLR